MKAVVMAGGKGSRLRPLTCDTPKPLMSICGKPVLEYIFDLLIRCGVDEACVTVGYLSDRILDRYPDMRYKSLSLQFSREPSPLGTAGSVRKAASEWQEPFFVVSGDAMCDFELDKIMEYHQASGAVGTVVAASVDDPREYGLIEKDNEGHIRRFLEKPSWGQATTDLANTGIYILDPACLRMIPQDEPYDFAKDLFPRMMEQGDPLFCYHAEGYWCDIGDIAAYLRCTRDLLQGRIRFPLRKADDGIFVEKTLPAGNYTLVPPVYIGAQADIGDGAQIGPFTCLESECSVGTNARVRASVLLSRSSVQAEASMQEAILCEGAGLREGAAMFEQSVAGANSVIGARATVAPGVCVWPQKFVDSGTSVQQNLQFGTGRPSILDSDGISENIELTAQMCADLGCAIGSISSCKKAGVGSDGTAFAKAMLRAIEAGMQSAGGHVWSFGECFEAQLSYCTAFCGLSVGVYVHGGKQPQIRIFGEGGLSVPRNLEREIESRMRRSSYNRCLAEAYRDVADMRSILLMYGRELMKQAPTGLRGMEASVQCANTQVSLLMEDTLLRLGCLHAQSLVFRISPDGMQTSAVTGSEAVPHEKLLAVACADVFREGMDVAVPYDAPLMLDDLAKSYGQKVQRYLSAPADDADAAARRLSARQIFLRDGLYLTVRVLGVMHKRQMTLDALCGELPPFCVEKKTFAITFSPARLHALLNAGADTENAVREGITLRRGDGRLLITPDRTGRSLRVLAEAANMETAAEMCSGFERLLSELETDREDSAEEQSGG